jgi:hypothetical protein
MGVDGWEKKGGHTQMVEAYMVDKPGTQGIDYVPTKSWWRRLGRAGGYPLWTCNKPVLTVPSLNFSHRA